MVPLLHSGSVNFLAPYHKTISASAWIPIPISLDMSSWELCCTLEPVCLFLPKRCNLLLNFTRRYTEAILENGAFIVENMRVLKPFILNGHDSIPGHAGVIINGNHWEFRGSTDSKYVDGKPLLETIYAKGYFKRDNPDYDPENLPLLDVKSLLNSSLVSMTGDEFYNNIPSSYGYVDHFRNYTKELHAVPYPECWAGSRFQMVLPISMVPVTVSIPVSSTPSPRSVSVCS